MRIRILGCGPSNGMPSLNRGFGLCDSQNPKNIRTRSAALIKLTNQTNILIDADPEIRQQLLNADNPVVDAVLFTHSHYDHMGGADDLRTLSERINKPLPVYLTQTDANHFQSMLNYLFQKKERIQLFDMRIIEFYQPFYIAGYEIIPIMQEHGEGEFSTGYKVGSKFAYSTDVKKMEKRGFDLLTGLDTWVLGGTTRKVNNKHINLDEALTWINTLKPRQVYLTHMGMRMDYETLCNELPLSIRPAYDGLEFDVNE